MQARTRHGIMLLAALAALSWLLARQPRDVPVDRFSRPDLELNYALYDFSGMMLNDQGGISLQIESPELRNNAASGIGTVDAPEIRIQQDQDRWYISAESAIISPDRERVILAGEVQLTRRDEATGQLLEISSSDITMDVTPRTAMTEAGVSMRQEGDRLDAVGMKLDMITETYELLHDVRAHYEMP
jgi:LPS export ABC transporter protein LptC